MPLLKQSSQEMEDKDVASVVGSKQCKSNEAFEVLWVQAVLGCLLSRVDFVGVAPRQQRALSRGCSQG